jgi:lysophospholipase L1-like esterase
VQAADLAYRAVKPFVFFAFLANLFVGLPTPSQADTEPARAKCDAPLDLLRLTNPLSRLSHKLAANEPITIVAIGSSSTAGAGASSASATYPSRLAAELKRHFPSRTIKVINRGVGGEEIPDMLKRFDEAVVANKPDLVLWQLGTNALIRDHRITDRGAAIRVGLKKIRAAGADIVLIDPQFAPKVNVKPDALHMVQFIATVAKEEGVALFRRYDVMKRWREVDRLPFKIFVAADGLHMNDWSYACMAKGLGQAIAEAAQRPVMSAKVMPQADNEE